MRRRSAAVDLVLGVIAGATLYALVLWMLPGMRGDVGLTVAVALATLLAARRRPGGSLRPAAPGPNDVASAPPREAKVWTLDRVVKTNLATLAIPSLLLRPGAAFVLAGLVLAIVTPMLARRGMSLNGWMVYAVLGAAVLIAVGPVLWRRLSPRAPRHRD